MKKHESVGVDQVHAAGSAVTKQIFTLVQVQRQQVGVVVVADARYVIDTHIGTGACAHANTEAYRSALSIDDGYLRDTQMSSRERRSAAQQTNNQGRPDLFHEWRCSPEQ